MTEVDTTTLESIMQTILTVFPDAFVGEDGEGQVVIHTGLYQVGDPSTPLISAEEREDRWSKMGGLEKLAYLNERNRLRRLK